MTKKLQYVLLAGAVILGGALSFAQDPQPTTPPTQGDQKGKLPTDDTGKGGKGKGKNGKGKQQGPTDPTDPNQPKNPTPPTNPSPTPTTPTK